MIRLRCWIERARERPVLGLLVLVLLGAVFLVSLLDLHEECPVELLAAACAALLAGALALGLRVADGPRGRAAALRVSRGRAPPLAPFARGLTLRAPPTLAPGFSPLLR